MVLSLIHIRKKNWGDTFAAFSRKNCTSIVRKDRRRTKDHEKTFFNTTHLLHRKQK